MFVYDIVILCFQLLTSGIELCTHICFGKLTPSKLNYKLKVLEM